MKFKEEYTFDQRSAESSRVLAKYPDRIPIICERNSRSNVQDMTKRSILFRAI